MNEKNVELKRIAIDDSLEAELKPDTPYLCKYNGKWYAGKFRRVWYGWNFDGIYHAGAQLSYDGWEEIYEIIESE